MIGFFEIPERRFIKQRQLLPAFSWHILTLTFAVITDVRLKGDSYNSGQVEVLYKEEWRPLADYTWNIYDAQVVCKQLGFVTAKSAQRSAHQVQPSGPIWLLDVRCYGHETTLSECECQRYMGKEFEIYYVTVECSGLYIQLDWSQCQIVNIVDTYRVRESWKRDDESKDIGKI